jgi:hypothetical protein
MRKIICASLLAASLFTTTGCEDWLDVNTNPNGPDQKVAPYLYLAPMQSAMALGIQYDARYLGKYIQNWASTATGDTWDRHGFVNASDASGEQWRNVYWKLGYNLSDMIAKAEEEQRWDFVGLGYTMRAWGWLMLTDYHGEIILDEAFDPTKKTFKYNTQEEVYNEVKRLLDLAVTNLERTDGAVLESNMSKGDLIYNGDRTKWLKFTYGLMAIRELHLSNKAVFNPNKVIEYVDKSLASNADNAMVRFNGAVNDDTNFFGPKRNNINSFRQTKFAVDLLDGTNPTFNDPVLIDPKFTGKHLKDPRLQVMMVPANDGEYRGVVPNGGVASAGSTDQRPRNLWNTTTDGTQSANTVGRYLFADAARFPLMTYSQLQFVKAEAAFKAGLKDVALTAYKNGVLAHLDFVQQYVTNDPATPEDEVTLYTQRKNAYVASTVMIPTDPNELTLQKIMLQKYIAQWGWGFNETWADLRRYRYDPAVFVGFTLPTSLFPLNAGKPAYRFRPRYNSEYAWNMEALRLIGGDKDDYHTKETWITESN